MFCICPATVWFGVTVKALGLYAVDGAVAAVAEAGVYPVTVAPVPTVAGVVDPVVETEPGAVLISPAGAGVVSLDDVVESAILCLNNPVHNECRVKDVVGAAAATCVS